MRTSLSASLIGCVLTIPAAAQQTWSLEYPGLCGPGYQLQFGLLNTHIASVAPGGEYVAGFSDVNTSLGGNDAWLYHNGATRRIPGLTGALYEPNGPAGQRSHTSVLVNAAGQVAGESRIIINDQVAGSDAWLYDGNTSTRAGLTGPQFETPTGSRNSTPTKLNEAGQMLGVANQYTPTGQLRSFTAWYYSQGTTVHLGLQGLDWTADDGYRTSTALNLLANGRVIGSSDRRVGITGRDWWVFQNGATTQINPASGEFLASNGKRESTITIKDDPDVIGGKATSYQTGTSNALAGKAWVYANGQTTVFQPPGANSVNAAGASNAEPILARNGAVVVYHGWYGSPGIEGGETWRYANGDSTRMGLVSPLGPRFSWATAINSTGSVIGNSRRYTGGQQTGDEAWLFTPAPGGGAGGTTISVHPAGASYVFAQQSSEVNLLTDQGHVVITARLSNPGGREVLAYFNGLHTRIDLSSMPGNTMTTGYHSSEVLAKNAAGLVLGRTERYDAANGPRGEMLWVWNAQTGETTRVPVPQSPGGRSTFTAGLCADGTVKGKYAQYTSEIVSRYRCFLWSPTIGFVDLENTAGATGMSRMGFAELITFIHPDIDPSPSEALSCGDTDGTRPGDFRPFIFRKVTGPSCHMADMGSPGGVLGADGRLDNNDFISLINLFFESSSAADVGKTGGVIGADGGLDNNDFIAFIELFFQGCG